MTATTESAGDRGLAFGAPPDPTRVVIAGGGIAALETVLALRSLMGDRAELHVVAPGRELLYAPMTVLEPFGGRADAFDLEVIAADLGMRLHHDTVTAVDHRRRVCTLASGSTLCYDALVLTPGATRKSWLPRAQHFGGHADANGVEQVVGRLRGAESSRVAFVAPPDDGWALPLYELAFLTASRLEHTGTRPRVSIVTPEDRPLEAFGAEASGAVARLLSAHGIDVWTESSAAYFNRPRLQIVPDGVLFVDEVVALARLEGPGIEGVPSDRHGFIHVDEYGRVRGTADVYAAGDGTNMSMKQGGLACQQADAAATTLAASRGTPVEPVAFRPVLRGALITGSQLTYLRRDANGSTAATDPLWQPAGKVAGRHVAPYLAALPGRFPAAVRRTSPPVAARA